MEKVYTLPLNANEIEFYDNKFRLISCKDSEIQGSEIISYIAGNQLNCDLADFDELPVETQYDMCVKYVIMDIPCVIKSLHKKWMKILFGKDELCEKYESIRALKTLLLQTLTSISLELPIRACKIPNEFPKRKYPDGLGYNALSLFVTDDIFNHVSEYPIEKCINIIDFYDKRIIDKKTPFQYITLMQLKGSKHDFNS